MYTLCKCIPRCCREFLAHPVLYLSSGHALTHYYFLCNFGRCLYQFTRLCVCVCVSVRPLAPKSLYDFCIIKCLFLKRNRQTKKYAREKIHTITHIMSSRRVDRQLFSLLLLLLSRHRLNAKATNNETLIAHRKKTSFTSITFNLCCEK